MRALHRRIPAPAAAWLLVLAWLPSCGARSSLLAASTASATAGTGGTPGTSGTGGGTGAPCASPRTVCGAACVDLGSDAQHCGGCAIACPAVQVCQAGACTCTGAAGPEAHGPLDVGFESGAIALGDLNGDRVPDLVAGDFLGGDVGVLRGAGDGSFGAEADEPVAAGLIESMALADVNGDGRLDLVVEHSGTSVLLGRGDGTFAPAVEIPGDGFVVAVGDVNGDGAPDLVVGTGTSVVTYPGHGDGTFSGPIESGGLMNAGGMVLADVNGDGRLDVVTSASETEADAYVLLGHGDGTFGPPLAVQAGGLPAVEVGDVNGDGKPDLVAVDIPDGTVSVLLGNGDGSFAKQMVYTVKPLPGVGGLGPGALADMNGDGHLDVVVPDEDGAVWVLLGAGDGSLGMPASFPVSFAATDIAVTDVNGDCKPDVVVTGLGTSQVQVLFGVGDGSLVP